VRLLSNMASAKEIQQYLKRFSQLDAAKFAVVKVGGAILRDELDALVSSLAFLQQVGLTPIVVHGAGPQLDEEMAAGRHRQEGGGRACAIPIRRCCRWCAGSSSRRTCAWSRRCRSRACAHFGHRRRVRGEMLDQAKYGLVGKVVKVHTASIMAAIKVRSIPVIASLAETTGGQILNVNADWAANELVKTLQPYKIVFLTGTGGLLDGEGDLIDSINLSTEYES
jgi:acetylglutamate kinase